MVYLEFVLKEVFLVWELAIHAEETLLIGGEGLLCVSKSCGIVRMLEAYADIDLVLLVRIHLDSIVLLYRARKFLIDNCSGLK